mmetsp:Transcript_7704/g.14633  ORF Transcript_7704/g.14633 Transcript_7704/m.14633 type:complete len:97 (-) Transcript_7704:1139-1429(-)
MRRFGLPVGEVDRPTPALPGGTASDGGRLAEWVDPRGLEPAGLSPISEPEPLPADRLRLWFPAVMGDCCIFWAVGIENLGLKLFEVETVLGNEDPP